MKETKMKKNEAIIVRNRGGKLLEIKIICHGTTSKNKRFSTDDIVEGAMETKIIPNNSPSKTTVPLPARAKKNSDPDLRITSLA